MNELRSILKERIENIFELQGLGMINESEGEFSNQKYEVMIEQKKAEKYRSIKETELLLSLNAMTLGQNSHIEEVNIEIISSTILLLRFAPFMTHLLPNSRTK